MPRLDSLEPLSQPYLATASTYQPLGDKMGPVAGDAVFIEIETAG